MTTIILPTGERFGVHETPDQAKSRLSEQFQVIVTGNEVRVIRPIKD